MPKLEKNGNPAKKYPGIDLRKLKKELKLIPFDIKREMRFLDLLFTERNIVRTQAEREVLKDMIDGARKMVEFYQGRLDRFEECYKRFKEKKAFDNSLLRPDELQNILKLSAEKKSAIAAEQKGDDLRTGTDG